MRSYIINVLYALDLLVNALFGGERYQTISARWGAINGHVRLWYWACRMLCWFDHEHCAKSAAEHEKIRKASQ